MLELKQTQKLVPVLTQQLQQAIKLLQLSQPELIEAIEQEIKENPLLEVNEETTEETPLDTADDNDETAEWLERYSASEEHTEREEKQYPDYENLIKKTYNLRDYIRWQIGLSDFDVNEKIIAEWILENINDNGYLAYPIEELSKTSNIPFESLERVLNKIQKLEPAGVGARDLKECILIQYELRGEKDPAFEHVVDSYFELFQNGNLKDIARKAGYPLETIKAVFEKIKSFDPKPGRNYGDEYTSYIIPDVYVVKEKDEFEVFLNDDEIPSLRMGRYYIDLYRDKKVNGSTRKYIKDKIKQAGWFIKSIQQRQRTLLLVSKSLARFQEEFLEQGIRFLKPLNLKDIAQDVGVHESTVSRVTTNKYISTPQGLYEMKFFFPAGIPKNEGDTLSSNVVMDLISEVVSREDRKHPMTDDEIVSILQEKHGIHIARRTVVKYREILHVGSSRARKISD